MVRLSGIWCGYNLSDVPTAKMQGYVWSKQGCVSIAWWLGLTPTPRAPLAPSWPEHLTWTCLDGNAVYLTDWGAGLVNRKRDMTLREGWTAAAWPQWHHQEGDFLYFWALLQRNFYQKGSHHPSETCVFFSGGCCRPPDSLTWSESVSLSLQCLLHGHGLAPDFLNLAPTKAEVPRKEPFNWWFKVPVFSL